MSGRFLHGQHIDDEQIEAWAAEAEAGYDLAKLPKPRRGRPPKGCGPGIVVPVRLDQETIDALSKRAESEGIVNRSDAVRAAIKAWINVA